MRLFSSWHAYCLIDCKRPNIEELHAMPPSLELRTKQSLALTPRLQQSVRLLQYSSREFQPESRNALDTNPFHEYDETQAEDNALSTDNGNSIGDTPPATDAQ